MRFSLYITIFYFDFLSSACFLFFFLPSYSHYSNMGHIELNVTVPQRVSYLSRISGNRRRKEYPLSTFTVTPTPTSTLSALPVDCCPIRLWAIFRCGAYRASLHARTKRTNSASSHRTGYFPLYYLHRPPHQYYLVQANEYDRVFIEYNISSHPRHRCTFCRRTAQRTSTIGSRDCAPR